MAAAKRYTAEQIVAKLREHEKLQGQGLTIPQACKRIGVSDQTFYRWRTKYGALKEDEAQRLKALEQENGRLKRIVAEQALDISMLKDLNKGRMKVKLWSGPSLSLRLVASR
jgi:putative transposase